MGGRAKLSAGIVHNLTAGGAFRDTVKAGREIWVTHFTSQMLDDMNPKAVTSKVCIPTLPCCHKCIPCGMLEVHLLSRRYAMTKPRCWKHTSLLNYSVTVGQSLQCSVGQSLQCNCGTVPARLTDGSGHVYKTDLAIVSDDVARNRMKKGTTFRDSYTKFHVYRTEDDDRPDEVILLEQSLDNYIKITVS